MYILQIENLHKKYNDFEAIRGIDISIEKGEIYGLLGPNGAGKSTLIKTISGLEKATSGKIIFEEKEANINKYKKILGYCHRILLYIMTLQQGKMYIFSVLYMDIEVRS